MEEERLLNWGSTLRNHYAEVKTVRPFAWVFEKPVLRRVFWLWGMYGLWILGILFLWLNLGGRQSQLGCLVFAVLAFGGFALTPYMTLTLVGLVSFTLAGSVRLLPIKKLITIVTLPLFIIGSGMLLVATFL